MANDRANSMDGIRTRLPIRWPRRETRKTTLFPIPSGLVDTWSTRLDNATQLMVFHSNVSAIVYRESLFPSCSGRGLALSFDGVFTPTP
jgi:hypothetical protein